MFWAIIGGDTIAPRILRLRRMKEFCQLGKFFFQIVYDPCIFAYNSFFPKFESLTATQMDLCVSLEPKCKICLRLSRIDF
jgi:hypothetical protein